MHDHKHTYYPLIALKKYWIVWLENFLIWIPHAIMSLLIFKIHSYFTKKIQLVFICSATHILTFHRVDIVLCYYHKDVWYYAEKVFWCFKLVRFKVMTSGRQPFRLADKHEVKRRGPKTEADLERQSEKKKRFHERVELNYQFIFIKTFLHANCPNSSSRLIFFNSSLSFSSIVLLPWKFIVCLIYCWYFKSISTNKPNMVSTGKKKQSTKGLLSQLGDFAQWKTFASAVSDREKTLKSMKVPLTEKLPLIILAIIQQPTRFWWR